MARKYQLIVKNELIKCKARGTDGKNDSAQIHNGGRMRALEVLKGKLDADVEKLERQLYEINDRNQS